MGVEEVNPPFLLDTCACHWLLDGTLSARPLRALTDAYNAGHFLFVSPITGLEIGLLERKRRFKSPLTPQKWFERLMSQLGARQAEMPAELLIESALLANYPNEDPFDRVIVTTAREYGFTVMTRDAAMIAYGREGYLSVLPC